MNEETTMFELLNERLEKEDIVKLVCNYDNKFNELEEKNKQLKNQLQQKTDKIEEIKELINYYGTTTDRNDNKSVRNILKQFLEIIDKGEK